ncbi:hypothetical protein EYF80_041185 [Liparis tanakae]|uniref:Uncharacterized protein n=1 Tax=Liparis tanakae TaxID=230148 RepID=A0A4Z2G4Y0_9TELE|nr:hypothetical protein EYF80_041185 [Liparis tanakae]
MWLGLGEEGHGGGVSGTSQSVEKRSPAEGSGARPPVTLGRRESMRASCLRSSSSAASRPLYSASSKHASSTVFDSLSAASLSRAGNVLDFLRQRGDLLTNCRVA